MGSRRSSSSAWLILPFLIEFLKSYSQIIWKKTSKHITIAIVCKTLRKTSSWTLTVVNHGRHWVPVNHVFSSPPASDLQRAVSQLGTDQDTSQLRNTLWVTKGPLEFSLILVFLYLNACLTFVQATENAARQPSGEGDWQTDEGVQCTSCRPWSGTN